MSLQNLNPIANYIDRSNRCLRRFLDEKISQPIEFVLDRLIRPSSTRSGPRQLSALRWSATQN
jgi:hypothetical protein